MCCQFLFVSLLGDNDSTVWGAIPVFCVRVRVRGGSGERLSRLCRSTVAARTDSRCTHKAPRPAPASSRQQVRRLHVVPCCDVAQECVPAKSSHHSHSQAPLQCMHACRRSQPTSAAVLVFRVACVPVTRHWQYMPTSHDTLPVQRSPQSSTPLLRGLIVSSSARSLGSVQVVAAV